GLDMDQNRATTFPAPPAKRSPELSLRSNQCASDRRVDVTHHEHSLRLLVFDHRLEASDYLCSLNRMRCRSNIERIMGVRDCEIAEKDLRELRIIMLSGVNETCMPHRIAIEAAHQGSDLHEVRSSTGDAQDFARRWDLRAWIER